LDEFLVVFLISNYHSKEHFNHLSCLEDEGHPEYKEYAKIPTERWQESTQWIEACCYYDAAKKTILDSIMERPDKFVEKIMTIRRRSDYKAIHNIDYLDPVQVYFPEGSYCEKHAT